MWTWNDCLLPLVIPSDPNTRTLPPVRDVFQGQFNTGNTTAFAAFLTAPLLLVYLFAQRRVISGVMRGSIKQ